MEQSTEDSGEEDLDMGKGRSNGKMEHLIMGNGSWGELKEKEHLLIVRDRSTKGNGTITQLKDLESTRIITKLSMKDNGMLTCRVEKEVRNGLMVQYSLANIETGRRMA